MAAAGAPRVQFDVSPIVAAVDVDQAEFLAQNPDERLVQVRLQASALVTKGDAARVGEIVFHFYSPEQSITVHEFSPQTTLVSDVVGNVNVTENREQGGNFQASLSGSYENIVQGSLGGGANRSRSEVAHFERLPAQEVLTASGRTARGSGAYFKMRSTSQSSVEGSHDFSLLLRVPKGWRGGYLRATCTARTQAGAPCGQSSWLVPLFAQGDIEAKAAARRLNRGESQLVRAASTYRRAISRASRPTFIHELALAEERIPDDWLSRLLGQPANGRVAGFESRLPQHVRLSASEFRAAKQELARLRDG